MGGSFFKENEKWFSYLPVVVLLVITLSFNAYLIKDFKALPSPLYGGDYYYQMGAVAHVKDGGSALDSGMVTHELPSYFVLYAFLVGNFAKIFGLSALTAMLSFSYIITAFATIVIYFFLKNLFGKTMYGIIGTLIFVSPTAMPIVKYTDFGMYLIIPLFLYTLYWFLQKRTYIRAIPLGIVYGLGGITHATVFIVSSLVLVSVFIWYSILPSIDKKKKQVNVKALTKEAGVYAIILLIGIPIALLWWSQPLFHFHGHTSQMYSLGTTVAPWSEFKNQLQFVSFIVFEHFLNFSSYFKGLLSVFKLLGIIGLFTIKTNKKEKAFVSFIVVTALIIVFHYFVTQNIFGFQFVPGYIEGVYLRFVLNVLLFCMGVMFIELLAKNINLHKTISFTDKGIAFMIILLLSVAYVTAYSERVNNQWYQVAKQPLPPQLIDAATYLESHTDVYTTILTTKEVGFALSALSGRKLLDYRRGHAPPFVYIPEDERELAQAIILFGNNTAVKRELIKKYNVSYIYWDYYWIQSEYTFNDKNQIVGWYDPLIMLYTPQFEQTLKENGVKYFVETTWIDPSIKGDDIPKFKLIFVSPENYYSFTSPWNPNLNGMLTEVWHFDSNGQRIAQLWKVN